MNRSTSIPGVYLRITDNWIELAVRFLCGTHHVRGLKDQISRQIMDELDAAHIGIASITFDVVGFPPIPGLPTASDQRPWAYHSTGVTQITRKAVAQIGRLEVFI